MNKENVMRPIDFVVFDGDSSPNQPAYKVAEAMMKPITVRGPSGDYVILSYYMDETGMVLDVEPREDA
jgi:hypothetical protein